MRLYVNIVLNFEVYAIDCLSIITALFDLSIIYTQLEKNSCKPRMQKKLPSFFYTVWNFICIRKRCDHRKANCSDHEFFNV